ncbi:hypothetical protein X741_33370 [Mesorhizobium sp. LNHC229A00]|nr:hypothetical protein X741_33370 [Mesorhizobium sp. LNHC229A00]
MIASSIVRRPSPSLDLAHDSLKDCRDEAELECLCRR